MSLSKYTEPTPDFRTYGECKHSSTGTGCTAAYAVSDLIDTTLNTISIPKVFATLHVPAGLACRAPKPFPVCAEVDSGKRAILAGPSDNIITENIFDRLVALASVEGVKSKKNNKTRHRTRGGSSDNKSKRRAKN